MRRNPTYHARVVKSKQGWYRGVIFINGRASDIQTCSVRNEEVAKRLLNRRINQFNLDKYKYSKIPLLEV